MHRGFAFLRPALFAALAALALTAPAVAESIVDDWASIKAPPPPPLKKVTVDPKTTALLVLDIAHQTCDPKLRPRCIAMLPHTAKVLQMARAKKLFVIYTLGAASKPADIETDFKPLGNEPIFTSGPDKFVNTDLDKALKEHGITTVIAIGSAAHGAVLHTAAGAGFRGYKVVVPIDAMASENTYAEQYTAWHLMNAPRLGSDVVTLTTIDMLD